MHLFTTVTDKQPSNYRNNVKTSSGGNRGTPAGSYELDEAQKKFGAAKAISSDQFFGGDGSTSFEQKANLTRFQDSNSISSADYFGDGSNSNNATRRGKYLLIDNDHYLFLIFIDFRKTIF